MKQRWYWVWPWEYIDGPVFYSIGLGFWSLWWADKDWCEPALPWYPGHPRIWIERNKD